MAFVRKCMFIFSPFVIILLIIVSNFYDDLIDIDQIRSDIRTGGHVLMLFIIIISLDIVIRLIATKKQRKLIYLWGLEIMCLPGLLIVFQ